MSYWVNRAFALLEATLGDLRHELNPIDWKLDLSQKGSRLAEHISAFANLPGGGFLAIGVNDAGDVIGIDPRRAEEAVARLSSVAREGVQPPIGIDHAIIDYEGKKVLLISIPESPTKPVHIRNKSIEQAFIRSGGTTRKASRQEVGQLLLNSTTPRWESLHASVLRSADEVVKLLEVAPILERLERTPPSDLVKLCEWMVEENYLDRKGQDAYYVTNLGAISAARDLKGFPDLMRKGPRVVVYDGKDKSSFKLDREGSKGYALGFDGLLDFVLTQLPQSEIIRKAYRVKTTLYPEIALRELIANALIHQDFTISGAGPMVEIFTDRIAISNPGGLLPSKSIDRLIGTQPEARNERLARAFRRYRICEELGSGLYKVGTQAELYGLPPVKFEAGENFFRVTLYAPKTYAQMTSEERLSACYQHACLRHVGGDTMTNKSLRDRLQMPDRHRSMVSNLLQQALERNLIKPADPENKSKKLSEYLPIWA